MKSLFSILSVIIVITFCNSIDGATETIERNLTVEVMSDIGVGLGKGIYKIKKTDMFMTVSFSRFSQYIGTTPDSMSMLFNNLRTMNRYDKKGNIRPTLFKFPLSVGGTWEWENTESSDRNLRARVTIENSETVKVSGGIFPNCLKHKTVFTDTKHNVGLAGTPAFAEVKNALVNGTRYLWFAKGVGLVKMRYEHSNGVITEAELIDSKVSGNSNEYLPLISGTMWTYKWHNNYFDGTFIETVQLSGKDNKFSDQVWRTLNVKVATEKGEDLREGVFNIAKTDSALALTRSMYRGLSGANSASILKHKLLDNITAYHETDLLRFPLNIRKIWTQPGDHRSLEKITIEGFEQVKIAAGTFRECLKQKTVLTGATTGSEAENAFVNGTRYLWFAKGVGIVKTRYEHSNGVVTEAELTKFHVPGKSEEYLPLDLGTTWTYKWNNNNNPKGFIEIFQVVEPGKEQEIREPEQITALKKASYVMSVNADAPETMTVICGLTPVELVPEKILLHLKGSGAYIREVTLVDARGRKPSGSWSTTGIWEFRFPRHTHDKDIKFPLTLSYKVSLGYDNRKWKTPVRPGTLPFSRLGITQWTSDELFIVGKQTNEIEVEFKLPESWWRVSTLWQPIGDASNKFTVTDQEELTNSVLLIGQHAEARVKSGKTEVVLAIGGRPKSYQNTMRDTFEQFLRAYSKVFNGEPEGRFMFLVNPYEKKVGKRIHGYETGRSVRILMDWTLDDATKHEWAPFLGYEVFRIWNGLTALNPFTAKERWFSYGVTNYYSEITSARLGYLSESKFLERLERVCELYLSAPRKFAIADGSTDALLLNAGGSLVAASLDLQIRHLTKNRKNFNHVMQQMYQKFSDNSIEYTQHDIIRTVNKVAGKDFDTFFKTYVTGKERLPLAEYFNYAGLDVQIEYSEELPTADYVYGVLKASIQNETWRLISVDGMKIEGFADLRESAKTWKSGDVLQVTIEVNDETLTLPITLSGVSENPPTTRDPSVRITQKAKTTRLQRAILADILGKN